MIRGHTDATATAPDPDLDPALLESLLRRCALRDRAAFAELYRVAAPRLLACLVAILRRRDAAEDALQECFVRIWRRADQFDAYRGRAIGWLVSIARYQAIDLVRAGRGTVALSDAISDTLDDPAAASEFDRTESSLTDAALQRCLEALPTEQRRSVVLAYSHGLTHDDIARRLTTPLGTVKSWVRRGLQGLRRCMQS
jgi:RNA polymerase sigma-70 factor (ECF subfamily)